MWRNCQHWPTFPSHPEDPWVGRTVEEASFTALCWHEAIEIRLPWRNPAGLGPSGDQIMSGKNVKTYIDHRSTMLKHAETCWNMQAFWRRCREFEKKSTRFGIIDPLVIERGNGKPLTFSREHHWKNGWFLHPWWISPSKHLAGQDEIPTWGDIQIIPSTKRRVLGAMWSWSRIDGVVGRTSLNIGIYWNRTTISDTLQISHPHRASKISWMEDRKGNIW